RGVVVVLDDERNAVERTARPPCAPLVVQRRGVLERVRVDRDHRVDRRPCMVERLDPREVRFGQPAGRGAAGRQRRRRVLDRLLADVEPFGPGRLPGEAGRRQRGRRSRRPEDALPHGLEYTAAVHSTLIVLDAMHSADLGDFTTTRRVVPIALLALLIGVFAALVAAALLKLIAFFTNVFFFQRLSAAPASPVDHHLGPFVVLVPIAGALVIGVMARYGSEKIRGHGIPEAIEAILMNGSRVEPKLAVLKPLSSAISIGSGGPFGA